MEEQNQQTAAPTEPLVSDASVPEKDEVQKTLKERDEYLDGWKRAKADLLNYKKDESKRFESVLKFSNEQILRDLLIVMDSFDLAIAALGEESKTEKGIFLIRAQFEDVLKRYGLERMPSSVGTIFDPASHDAVATVESTQESGTITEEVECGYMLGGKVIRPVRVKVAK
ncbi:MAG: nucleotide exchange factor GrpE [Candidatus Paceibacterota bacterium]